MKPIYVFFLLFGFYSCQTQNDSKQIHLNPLTHSFSNIEDVTTSHLDWKVSVDFEKKQIYGVAIWNFANKKNANEINFDIYDLSIKNVQVNGKVVKYSISDVDSNFGQGLSIPIHAGDSVVSIEYHTGANATSLQWLAPEQTSGKKLPYLFTQCESIYARSLVPCQDVPQNRITYDASVTVPKGMMALMSAKNPTQKNEQGEYHFEMEIPIPTYLIALAVGDIAYQAIDERTGVYTEPSNLGKVAQELSDIPAMMSAAEKIGGPYRWGKYDVLIAPPSFPIGGMENPRLTFATPTIIAGDKSLVSLIAHEMAHSWSGNLVTNALWHDLWLNEGFTTYFERRIMEEISGKEYTDMLWKIGEQDMESDFADLGKNNPDTRLQVDLNGRTPDAAFSNIPYEKGALFLKMLEENVGRKKFDIFMNAYFGQHSFQTMTTDTCIAFMDKYLFDGDSNARNKLLVREWIFQPGLPANSPVIKPKRFELVDKERSDFEKNGQTSALQSNLWSTHEWLHFLRKLPHPLSYDKMISLDKQFHLTNTENSEIAMEWFKLAIASKYEEAYSNLEVFLSRVGRKKFLEPLYGEMIQSEKGKEMAKRIFEKYKMNYHPLTALKIGKMIYTGS